MKNLLLTFTICLFSALPSFAQYGFDFSVSPNITFVSLNNGNKIVNADMLDSMKNIHGARSSVSFEVDFFKAINNNMMFEVGLRYNNTGFTKNLTDLQFHDSIHPDIDRIQDLSVAASKDASLKYNVHYFEIPARINYRLSPNSKAYKYNVYLTGGVTFQYRFTDYVNIDLTGFTVDGQSNFKKEKSYLNFNNFNAGPNIGIRAQYRLAKNVWLSAKPEFFLPIGAAIKQDIQYHLYQFSGNVGLSLMLD